MYVNSNLIEDGNGPILIDTGKDRSGKNILQKINEQGLKISDIVLIILTHPHFDRCMDVPAINSQTGRRRIAKGGAKDTAVSCWYTHLMNIFEFGK